MLLFCLIVSLRLRSPMAPGDLAKADRHGG
jgi:hypothetical protein